MPLVEKNHEVAKGMRFRRHYYMRTECPNKLVNFKASKFEIELFVSHLHFNSQLFFSLNISAI